MCSAMNRYKSDNIFVSYTRKDERIVSNLVKILRVRDGFVFLDVDSIAPGSKWRDEVESSILGSSKFLLFWCVHARDSVEVHYEYQFAVSRNISLVPVLLDDTPLDSDLSPYQWIDLRALAADTHRHLGWSVRRYLPWIVGSVLVILLSLLFLGAERASAPNGPPQSGGGGVTSTLVALCAAVVVVIGAFGWLSWVLVRRRQRSAASILAAGLRRWEQP
jgi:hypothetical protein